MVIWPGIEPTFYNLSCIQVIIFTVKRDAKPVFTAWNQGFTFSAEDCMEKLLCLLFKSDDGCLVLDRERFGSVFQPLVA